METHETDTKPGHECPVTAATSIRTRGEGQGDRETDNHHTPHSPDNRPTRPDTQNHAHTQQSNTHETPNNKHRQNHNSKPRQATHTHEDAHTPRTHTAEARRKKEREGVRKEK